jgi:hypothetical protein
MAVLVRKCLYCSGPLPPPKGTGRPKRYCCESHRLKAKRQRSVESGIVVRVGPDKSEAVPVGDILPGLAADPDELVAQAIMDARALSAEFGVASQRARPEFSWRCGRMADHIASGLRDYFS